MKTALSFDDVLLVPRRFTGDSRKDIDIGTKIGKIRLQIPLIAANMPSVCETDMALTMGQMGGLGIIHRMQPVVNQGDMVFRAKEALRICEGFDLPVGAAIGIGDDWKERATHLLDSGADIICLDVAHGHSDRVITIIRKFKEEWPDVPLIAGNIATGTAASDLSFAGANVLKVGVGGGSVCTTRIKTGCGVPTLQSVMDCSEYLKQVENYGVTIIADGGIKNSGDVCKSLAAGADAVMIGSLLAGTDEAPGEVIKGTDGNKYKIYRGAASFGAKKEFFGKAEYVEGEETLVPYRGPAHKVITKLCDGIRSGFSYCGVNSTTSMQYQSEFIQITGAGMKESKPHGLL